MLPTHAPTHARSKSNMPHQLFQSWGHKKPGGGGQGGCVQRMEVIAKRKKVMRVGRGVRVDVTGEVEFLFGGGGGQVVWGGGQSGCVQRSEAFLKIQNIFFFFFFLGGGV